MSAPRPGGPGAPSGAPAQAPAESKRGEVNELRAALRAVNAERGFDAATARRKREVIRKCIAYMTLGIDVSRLFPDMVMACNSRASAAPAGGSYAQVASQDLVIKKMVYLYLTNYAQVRPLARPSLRAHARTTSHHLAAPRRAAPPPPNPSPPSPARPCPQPPPPRRSPTRS